ncbi:hypothetical protein FY557_04280 [Chryseobacterium sp. SN22]|uniref:hypothetical protein n=1 Tax=Chryseobacterium sp. SN22 TaxID=2606431 RepID=UPI0011EBF3C5|nr:hypothetical protein [Chryseobacterium sp. SN22]KAA0129932.1 hypothetical protein FY557_04280 [Chryseobacterium sp. SN22]
MSTTDLNTNNSSQTLFRFATMRNPELSDPKNKERRFIFRDDQSRINSSIDNNLSTSNSLQKLLQNPGFIIFTEKSLKTDYAAFYDYAVWVARNKATATKEEFDKKIKACKTANGIPTVDNRIWDNLVYQVVMQKEFYAKELIMQILHLYHILSVYDFTEEAYQDVVKAKVVLPKELFKASQSAVANTSGSTTTQRTVYDNKAMKFAEATVNLKANEALADSISKLEKTYKKQYDAAYKTAYDQYQNEVKPLLKSLQKDTAEADRKKQILENRINYLTQLSVADPEKFYANSELDMELHRIKDEIMQITIPETEIPDFEFSYKTPEIDAAILGRTLSVQDQNALLRLFGASSVTEALSGITTFDELNQNITQNTQALQQTVLNNTVLNQQVSANVGGVVIPVSNSLNPNGWIPYSVKTYNNGNDAWSILLTIDGFAHNIVSGSYKVTINGNDISSNNIIQTTNGVHSLFYNGTTIPAFPTTNINGFILQGEVVLNDGKTYLLNVTLTRDSNEFNRPLKQYIFKGDAALTLKQPPKTEPENPENPIPTTNPANPEAFIPSGFGMKNIGVADYLKVEQSLQGYVEGEVAHIENVMARERREKATKKTSKSEITTVESSDSEKEQLRDTSSTERFEMQNEIAKAMQQTKDAHAEAHVDGSYGGISFGVSGGFATHNSKEENTKQAMTQAKEITQKATDRIVTKVHKERTEKMIEEFEETNIHEFDNRKGDKHVVGVYRWVDKVFKNQIYNYGKRMMFEFMIPEPAKLHILGMKISKNTDNTLIQPVDPRESTVFQMKDFISLNGTSGDIILKYWAGVYNVELEQRPKISKKVSYSFSEKVGIDFTDTEKRQGFGRLAGIYNNDFDIPEDYIAVKLQGDFSIRGGGWEAPHQMYPSCLLSIANRRVREGMEGAFDAAFKNPNGSLMTIPQVDMDLNNIEGKLGLFMNTWDVKAVSGAFTIFCELTQEANNAWLQKSFNKIIAAYEKAKAKYDQDLAAIKAQGVEIKGSNPGFYRQIENTVLRRNCISYMINQDPSAALTFGKDKYYRTNSSEESFLNTEIKLDSTLDKYTAFVKFMEQAFEWEIMSYYFYPYYWGNRNNWDKMYQFDDNDATFRAFMQSGMARVIVTVRPGFEEAVGHFMSTGQIWNGGEVPVIDDPMFLSIVDEMRKTEGEKYGKAWASRVPTALTILQAQSIGLNVTKALPFDDNLSDYEDPTKVPQSSQIVPTDAQMGGSDEQKTGSISGHIEGLQGLLPEIMLKNKDKSPVDFTNPDDKGDFWMENIPVGKYELCLDENDDFDNQYSILKGKVTRIVEVKESSTTTVYLEVKKN